MFASVSGWVLSIAGVISLSVIVELMLPEGSVNKYIRTIFSFIIMLVIIAPLPSLVGKNFNLDSIIPDEEFTLQEDYIYQLNVYKTEALQEGISQEIVLSGYEGVNVHVSSENFSTDFKIKAIYVELANLVITDKAEHKDILDIEDEIAKIVIRQAKVDREVVIFER